MREYLYRGIRIDTREWVEGGIYHQKSDDVKGEAVYIIGGSLNDVGCAYQVVPRSVGQYTGMNEFVMSDRSYNKPLFEGDIVEVWGMRCSYNSNNPQSQYDGWMKVRAVIRFKRGQWILDDKNKYNESLTKLKGKEEDDRTIDCSYALSWYGYHSNSENEEWHREHNKHYKYSDIVKIGTEFENSELLEG
jgi:hypothetical protein